MPPITLSHYPRPRPAHSRGRHQPTASFRTVCIDFGNGRVGEGSGTTAFELRADRSRLKGAAPSRGGDDPSILEFEIYACDSARLIIHKFNGDGLLATGIAAAVHIVPSERIELVGVHALCEYSRAFNPNGSRAPYVTAAKAKRCGGTH